MQPPAYLATWLVAACFLPYTYAQEVCPPGTHSAQVSYRRAVPGGNIDVLRRAQSETCTVCEANYYCRGGRSAARMCPMPHQGSLVNSSSIKDCTCMPGYYSVDGGECSPCRLNRFCPGGDADVACSAFQTSPEKSSSKSACSCRPGYLRARDGCRKCLKGRYCLGGDAGEKVCPSNTVSAQGGISLASCVCKPGLYTSTYGCSTCPAGSFCILGAQNACPAHSSSTVPGSANCTCHAGFHRYSSDADGACIDLSVVTGAGQNTTTTKTTTATEPGAVDTTTPAPPTTEDASAVVSTRITLAIDRDDFDQNLRDAFTRGVASALQVQNSAVKIAGVERLLGGGVRRRLLLAQTSSTAVDTEVTVAPTDAQEVASRVTSSSYIVTGLRATMPSVEVKDISSPTVTGGSSASPESSGGASVLLLVLLILAGFGVCVCSCVVFLAWGVCQCCEHVASPIIPSVWGGPAGFRAGVERVLVVVHPPVTPYAVLH